MVGPVPVRLGQAVGLKVSLASTCPSATCRPRTSATILEVRLTAGKEALIPFVYAIVPEVDLEAGTCTITPPEGLLEL